MATPAPRRGQPRRDEPHLVDLVGRERRRARRAVAARAARARCARQVVEPASRRAAPQSTTRPPTSQNASKRAAARVRGEHEPRPRVGGGQHAAEALEQLGQPLAAARAATPRARSAGASAAAAHLARRRGRAAPRPPSPLAGEQRERLVEPAAVEVRVEVAQARRQAAAHLPVGRRAARAAAAPRPQWRSPNSELSCSSSSTAGARPRSGPIADRRARAPARARPRAPGTRCRGGSAGRRSGRRA